VADATNAWRIRFSRGELWFLFFLTAVAGAFFLVFDWLGVDFFVVPDVLGDGWAGVAGVAGD